MDTREGGVVGLEREGMLRTDELGPGVKIRRVEIDRSVEVQRLLDRVAREKEAILEAKRDAEDHERLMAENNAALRQAMIQFEEAEKKEKEMEVLKLRLLEEEQRMEEQRALKHAEAVNAENERAAAKAEKIVADRTFAHTQDLAHQHSVGAKHARDLEAAHAIALKELEELKRKIEMEEEVDVEVLGERVKIESEPVDIEVKVEAEHIPEARTMRPVEIKRGTLRAHIEEEIPERPIEIVEAERVVSVEERETTEKVQTSTVAVPTEVEVTRTEMVAEQPSLYERPMTSRMMEEMAQEREVLEAETRGPTSVITSTAVTPSFDQPRTTHGIEEEEDISYTPTERKKKKKKKEHCRHH